MDNSSILNKTNLEETDITGTCNGEGENSASTDSFTQSPMFRALSSFSTKYSWDKTLFKSPWPGNISLGPEVELGD